MRKWCFIILMACSPVAQATTIGLGLAASDQPALSIHWGQNFVDAFHLTTQYGPQKAQVTADYQRFFIPDFGFGYSYKLGFYTGGGLSGSVESDAAHEEAFYLRLPFGTQVDFHAWHLQVFAEGTARLGELPRTALSSGFMTGVRAQF